MKEDKIQMLLRQTTSLFPMKYIVGYGVPADSYKKEDYFC